MKASTSQGLRRFPVFAAAAAGVLGGHWLTYVLIVAEPAHRDAVLSTTGHGYLRIASVTALVLIVLALGSAVMCSLDTRSDPAGAPRAARVRRLFPQLWLIQGLTFAGMEVAERLAAGAPLRDILLGRVLVVGIIVQALVAAVGTLLLHALHRGAAGLARLVGTQRAVRSRRVLPVPGTRRQRPRTAMLAGATGVRGPPLA